MERHMKDSILPVVLKSEMGTQTQKWVHRHIYLGIRRFNLRNEQVVVDTWAINISRLIVCPRSKNISDQFNSHRTPI